MTIRNNERSMQGPSAGHGAKPYHLFQDLIRDETGIDCSVFIAPDHVSIRLHNKNPAEHYAEYIVARKVIAGRVSVPIRMDIFS